MGSCKGGKPGEAPRWLSISFWLIPSGTPLEETDAGCGEADDSCSPHVATGQPPCPPEATTEAVSPVGACGEVALSWKRFGGSVSVSGSICLGVLSCRIRRAPRHSEAPHATSHPDPSHKGTSSSRLVPPCAGSPCWEIRLCQVVPSQVESRASPATPLLDRRGRHLSSSRLWLPNNAAWSASIPLHRAREAWWMA